MYILFSNYFYSWPFAHFLFCFTDVNNVVQSKTAILLPLGGSLMLLALFFFLDKIYLLLVALMTFSATVSLCYVLWPAFVTLPNRFNMQTSYE